MAAAIEIFLFYRGPPAEQKHRGGGRGAPGEGGGVVPPPPKWLPKRSPIFFLRIIKNASQFRRQNGSSCGSSLTKQIYKPFFKQSQRKVFAKYTVDQSQHIKTTVFYSSVGYFVVCISDSHNARQFNEIFYQNTQIST